MMKIQVSASDSAGRIKPRLAVTVDEVPRMWVIQLAAERHSTVSAVVNQLLWSAYESDQARKGVGAVAASSGARSARLGRGR